MLAPVRLEFENQGIKYVVLNPFRAKQLIRGLFGHIRQTDKFVSSYFVGRACLGQRAVNENYRTSELVNEETGEVEKPSEVKERVAFIQVYCYQPNLLST